MGSMTDVSIGMVPYYNPLTMYRQQQQPTGAVSAGAQQQLAQQAHQQAQAQHAAMQQQAVAAANADLTSAQQYWYGYPHRHPSLHPQATAAPPQQYLEHPADVLSWPHHPHYSHHLQYQHHHHQQAYQQQQQQQAPQISSAVSEWSGDESSHHHSHQAHRALETGETSPPRTVSGSEISSPGTPASPPATNNNNPNVVNNNNNNEEPGATIKAEQVNSPFEWMNKPSYQSQANPGKTRTKDKYRVVYTDHQRLELEKEFHFSRYITIRRKSELAANLALSERQVKIWFQNRRAKERKQTKKREELEQKDMKPVMESEGAGGMVGLGALGGMSSMLGGLMHNGGSPPLGLGPPPHNLAGYSASSLHAHSHQHAHSHPVLGL